MRDAAINSEMKCSAVRAPGVSTVLLSYCFATHKIMGDVPAGSLVQLKAIDKFHLREEKRACKTRLGSRRSREILSLTMR